VSPSDSWFRNNQLANVLWDYDVRIVNALGVGQILPVWFRVIYIAFNTSLGVLLSLSFVNRFGMRILRESIAVGQGANFCFRAGV
jgi:hypothetical protein